MRREGGRCGRAVVGHCGGGWQGCYWLGVVLLLWLGEMLARGGGGCRGDPVLYDSTAPAPVASLYYVCHCDCE